MKVSVIGGGAAGFFSAINVKLNHPKADVTIFEKTQKLLAKVKVSGGGRCNVTNANSNISSLHKAYPRGGKAMKKLLKVFNTKHTIEWFEERGVSLYAQEDNRVFPKSNKSQSIIDCLLNEVQKLSIKIETGINVIEIIPKGEQLVVHFLKDKNPVTFDKVIVACGGSPKRSGLEWLEQLGHKIEAPVPSLFTFNIPDNPVTDLMGLVVDPVLAHIQGMKLKTSGPLLVTHWGFSGPAILKLSAFGARLLNEMNYDFKVQINWLNESNNKAVYQYLLSLIEGNPNKALSNQKPENLPNRMWQYLVLKANLNLDKKWGELGKKGLNKLTNILCNDVYEVKGKTTFKEEFVTCGGISLESVGINTMQSKVCKNLYFAGEILDVDGITGGYNFQTAWTTGFVAGKLES